VIKLAYDELPKEVEPIGTIDAVLVRYAPPRELNPDLPAASDAISLY